MWLGGSGSCVGGVCDVGLDQLFCNKLKSFGMSVPLALSLHKPPIKSL